MNVVTSVKQRIITRDSNNRQNDNALQFNTRHLIFFPLNIIALVYVLAARIYTVDVFCFIFIFSRLSQYNRLCLNTIW